MKEWLIWVVEVFIWWGQLWFCGDIDRNYFERSVAVKTKYDGVRRREHFVPLKLATNSYDDMAVFTELEYSPKRENATLLMLVRNWELSGALASMRSLEDRFNRKYNYDWVFLNDVPFDEDFMLATSAMASGMTYYGMVPPHEWSTPTWINEDQYAQCLRDMEGSGVIYGGSRSYRNMCRFYSGFFYKQDLLKNYDYYMRVEPNVEYFCDFPYDPFKVMRANKYKYGFLMSLYEYENTIPHLWHAVEDYINEYGHKLNFENNSYSFLVDKDHFSPNTMGIIESHTDYNLCHFWSNFEVGDLSFFRSKEYEEFFDFMDQKGGFYYERWGDAPIHTIAASLLLNTSEVIHFDELGYRHEPYLSCPRSLGIQLQQRCLCDVNSDVNLDISLASCLPRWWRNGSGKTFVKPKQFTD